MAVAGCINAYDCAGCYLTTLQQLQSDNIGVAINYTAPGEYGRRQLDYIKYTDKCGCTCCLTGENELKIVATQGVIKNFTLTNDDTNEVVNVKWNDLFGSNRAYTMVRYKTGSYPTSITDGTLAVKETTQNQYATSGYNVSGLTDGTTYYFTAFAVSQDGTIIVVQNNTITPEFDRKPTSNTKIYLPLMEDYKDKISGTVLSTTGTVSLVTEGNVKCTRLNGGQLYGLSNAIITGNGARTLNFRFKYYSISGTDWGSVVCWGGESNYNFYSLGDNGAYYYAFSGYSAAADIESTTTLSNGVWYNMMATYSGGTLTIYLNSVLIGSKSVSLNTSSSNLYIGGRPSGTCKANGFVNRVIIEDRGWTQAEGIEYYNKTKKYFGY